MTIDDVKTIGVVGAGQMGRGIAQVLATSGWNVLLVDVAEEVLEEAAEAASEAPSARGGGGSAERDDDDDDGGALVIVARLEIREGADERQQAHLEAGWQEAVVEQALSSEPGATFDI